MNSDVHLQLHQAMADSADDLIDLHRRLVQIPSVNQGDGSSAREDEVAAVAADFLSHRDVSLRIVESAPGRANLLARTGEVSMAGSSRSDGGRSCCRFEDLVRGLR